MKYNQREIVLVPFPYSGLSSTKKRPVLIISNDGYNQKFDDVVVVCVITSNIFQDEYSVPLTNSNLELGVLPESSVVKVHKLFTINKTRILKKCSIVTNDYFNSINKVLTELFANSNK